MYLRLGDLLVERGVLTDDQRLHVLEEQQKTGEPFGTICERILDIPPEAIEEAWAEQYVGLTRKVDPRHEVFEERALALVSRRQAWQFRVLPIRFDGDELMLATTGKHVARALRFCTRFIGTPVYLVVAESEYLGEAMCKRYPLAGMTPRSIDDEAMDRLITMAMTSSV